LPNHDIYKAGANERFLLCAVEEKYAIDFGRNCKTEMCKNVEESD